MVANLWLVSTYVVSSARIDGGEAAARVIRGRLPRAISPAAVWLSSLSNLPARALFAWRHEASLKDYDRVVGVHVLGDLYPGLNGPGDQTRAQIGVQDTKSPLLRGLSPAADDAASIVDSEARILVVLNRDDSLDIRTIVDGSGPVTVSWNGVRVLEQPLGPHTLLHFRTSQVRRGANDLVIRAAHGTTVHPIDVEAVR